ncbi:MAG TPA: hypothetical protein VJQ81_08845 [Reyranella sp.]|jgi:hypothetical protein|nr:hypothetical protein [Reyranella sp.]
MTIGHSRLRTLHVGIGLLLANPSAVLAQATVAEWSTVASTTNATCGEGFSADVVEVPGSMTLTFLFNGKKVSEVSIMLAADGSGRVEASGIAGRMLHEVAAGKGKRPIRSSQVGGVCRWSWMPN